MYIKKKTEITNHFTNYYIYYLYIMSTIVQYYELFTTYVNSAYEMVSTMFLL